MIKKIIMVMLLLSTYLVAGINVQTASKAELMSISGIGEKKADAIIKYRKTHKLKSADDLLKVKGIGQGIVSNVKGNKTSKMAQNASKNMKNKKQHMKQKGTKAYKKSSKMKNNISKDAKSKKQHMKQKGKKGFNKSKKSLHKKKNQSKSKMKNKAKKMKSKVSL